MCNCLQKIGTEGVKAAESSTISMSNFLSHFVSIAAERYEEYPSVSVSVIERVKDMRMDDKAITVNERMNQMSEWEETVEAMKQIKDSAPGKDGMRLGY